MSKIQERFNTKECYGQLFSTIQYLHPPIVSYDLLLADDETTMVICFRRESAKKSSSHSKLCFGCKDQDKRPTYRKLFTPDDRVLQELNIQDIDVRLFVFLGRW